MIPLNLLCRLASRPAVALTYGTKPLSTSSGLMKQCKSSKDKSQQQCKSQKKSKGSKSCPDTSMESYQKKFESRDDDALPDYCSKKMAMECAKKIKELQKHWEAIAAAAAVQEAASGGSGSHRKPESCPVKPPQKEGKNGGSNLGIIIGVLVLFGIVIFYMVTHQEEGKEGDDKKGDDNK